jgi:predicted RNA-binding Zn-ribbon protein involved in translation (DUF1610 family)
MSEKRNYCPTCDEEMETTSLHCPSCGTVLTQNPNLSRKESGASFNEPGSDLASLSDGKSERVMTLKFKNRDCRIAVKNGDILGRNFKGKEIFRESTDISRSHAKITYENGEWFIEDLSTENGTYIKGKKIKKAKLDIGDSFTVAEIYELSVVKC